MKEILIIAKQEDQYNRFKRKSQTYLTESLENGGMEYEFDLNILKHVDEKSMSIVYSYYRCQEKLFAQPIPKGIVDICLVYYFDYRFLFLMLHLV